MFLRVIKPLIEIESNENIIKIKGFLDENNNIIESIDELFNTGEQQHTKFYCYGYQLVIAEIEKW